MTGRLASVSGRRTSRSRARSLRGACLAAALAAGVLVGLGAPGGSSADPPVPSAPFAAFQYATDGCIEVGVRPQPPYNQLPPYRVPDSYDRIASGYPTEGYDPAALGFAAQPGTNSCRYKFYDKNPKTDPSAVVIGSGYCVEWAAGQLSGTGYDPEPVDGTVVNEGYVRYILEQYWPATDDPRSRRQHPRRR